MTTDTSISPDAEIQNPAPEVAVTPPVATDPAAPEQVKPPEQQTEPAEDESAKALKRMQRRIDKRTADVYRERAEKEHLAERIARLESQLQPQPEQQPPALDPKDFEREVLSRAEEIARLRTVTEKCNAVAASGKKAFSDFDDALTNLAGELGDLFDKRGLPTPTMQVILESDAPDKLLHFLGTNPDVAAELADLTPTQFARRIERIERDATVKPKTTSLAPKPLEPVKGQGTAKDVADMSDAEFAAFRKRQIAQRR